MSYPGLHTNVKTYLWPTVCMAVLTYGMDSVTLTNADRLRLNSLQGSLIKNCLGLSKRSHHSDLLHALHLCSVSDVINDRTLSLFYRIFLVDSPLRKLSIFLVSKYLENGLTFKGTLVDRIIEMGHSPITAAFNCPRNNMDILYLENGVVDTLNSLLFTDAFIKPWSAEHLLTALLTKAF